MKKLLFISIFIMFVFAGVSQNATYKRVSTDTLKATNTTVKKVYIKDTANIVTLLRIPTGAGANKIFTSNTSGDGSWQVHTSQVDSFYVFYCGGCAGITGLKVNGDTIFIDSSLLVTKWRLQDSLNLYTKTGSDTNYVKTTGTEIKYGKLTVTDTLKPKGVKFQDNTYINSTKYHIYYCNGCAGATGVKYLQDTIYIDSAQLATRTWVRDSIAKKITTISEIYTIGNSLTAAGTYQTQLLTHLNSSWNIVNFGIAGELTPQMANRITNLSTNANTVIVWGGVNDAGAGTPAATIQANLQAMYTAIHNTGSKVIALTISPWEGSAYWNAGRQAISDAVNTWIMTAALNVDYKLDIYSLLEDPSNPDALLPAYDSGDHLHLTVAGYNAVGDYIYNNAVFTETPAKTLSITNNYTLDQALTTQSNPSFSTLTLNPTCTANPHAALYIGLNTFAHNWGLGNTYTGSGAGNFAYPPIYNSAHGTSALQSITTGSYLTADGSEALKANTTGTGNSAFGAQALTRTTTGNNCIGIGLWAGKYNTTQSNRLYINGYYNHSNIADDTTLSIIYGVMGATTAAQQLYFNSNVTISDNLLLKKSTADTANITFKNSATGFTSSDGSNIGIGKSGELYFKSFESQPIRAYIGSVKTLSIGTGGSFFAGLSAGAVNTSTSSIGIGESALVGNIGGTFNFAGGWRSMYSNVSGNYNTGIGAYTLYNNTGSNNAAFGAFAGTRSTAANSNRLYINSIDRTTALGDSTLSIIYGYQAATTAAQQLYLNSNVTISNNLTLKTGEIDLGMNNVLTTQKNLVRQVGWYGYTSDTTTTEIFLDSVANSRITLPTYTTITFEITVHANSVSTDSLVKAWTFTGSIRRAGGTNITIVGVGGSTTPNKTVISEDATLTSLWDVYLNSVNGASGYLKLRVKGGTPAYAAEKIKWSAYGELVQTKW